MTITGAYPDFSRGFIQHKLVMAHRRSVAPACGRPPRRCASLVKGATSTGWPAFAGHDKLSLQIAKRQFEDHFSRVNGDSRLAAQA